MPDNVRLSEAAQAIVEAALERFSGKNGKGIHIVFDVRASGPYDEETGDFVAEMSTNLHLLVYRPTNYTQVYFCEDDGFRLLPRDPAVWELKSDHDSCWRTDGFRSLFEGCLKLKQACAKEVAKVSDITEDEAFNTIRMQTFVETTRITMETSRVPGVSFGPGRRKVVSVKAGWPK